MRNLRILTYHEVEDERAFVRQLDSLERWGRPVSLDEVHAWLEGEGILPARAFLLTFDDGLRSHTDTVGPLLARRGLPGAFYVVTGVLGTTAPYWWEAVLERTLLLAAAPLPLAGKAWGSAASLVTHLKGVSDEERRTALCLLDERFGPPTPRPQATVEQCRDLVRLGHRLGNHSHSHPLLDQLDDEALHAELSASHDAFVALFPEQPRSFAFPNGNHDERSVRWLRDSGYRSALLFDHGLCRSGDPLQLSRLRVSEEVAALRWYSMLVGADSLRLRLRPAAVQAGQVPLRRRRLGAGAFGAEG